MYVPSVVNTLVSSDHRCRVCQHLICRRHCIRYHGRFVLTVADVGFARLINSIGTCLGEEPGEGD